MFLHVLGSFPTALPRLILCLWVLSGAMCYEHFPFNPDIHLDPQFKQGGLPKTPSLAIVILANPARLDWLIACLKLLEENVLPNNPADILIFHTGEFSLHDEQQLVRSNTSLPLAFLPIPQVYWRLPNHVNLSEQHTWANPEKGVGYRHMCRWFGHGLFLYLSKAGYNWMMRIDDDSKILSKIDYNIVDMLEASNKVYGFRTWLIDSVDVVYALAELARFFIIEERMEPTWIYKMCHPQNIDGLTTKTWNHGYFYSNWYITKIGWWMQPKVQRFLRLVDVSGGYYKFRWGDQIAHTMTSGLFMQESQIHRFTFAYKHKDSMLGACNQTVFDLC